MLNFVLIVYFGPSPIKDLYLYVGHFSVKSFLVLNKRFDSLIFHDGLFLEMSIIL